MHLAYANFRDDNFPYWQLFEDEIKQIRVTKIRTAAGRENFHIDETRHNFRGRPGSWLTLQGISETKEGTSWAPTVES